MLIVTADNLPRLMACNGFRLMDGFKPSIISDDTIREEGIAAHWLIQQVYSGKITAEELIDRKAPNGVFITAEMVEHIQEFLDADPSRIGQVEIETSHAGQRWQVNGRADRVVYDREKCIIYIDDFKYGWRLVEPEMNWTLISHAIGFMQKLGPTIYAQTKIIMRIFQPRPYHTDGTVRAWQISVEDSGRLYHELNNTLSDPSDFLKTNPHCYRCPAFVNCPAARAAAMTAIDVSEHPFNDKVDNDTLSVLLDQINRASEVLDASKKAFEELALHRVRFGERIANYATEKGQTNRVWKEFVTPELLQNMTGKNLTKPKLVTPKQAETAGVPKETVAAFCERRDTALKLVRIDENKKAQKLFNT